ncbi:MAG: glycosyltransferase, partial [Silvanigrellaceae bacterium]|nr:glycosyltransferase [Silvanigrellaceae bacterium]
IISQSYTNWELIICDDFSTDKTVEIIDNYASLHNNIKLLRNDSNYGAAISRNNAMKLSKGRFICFCDSDDVWHKFKLEKQINFMTNNSISFTYTNYYIIDSTDKIIGKKVSPEKISYSKLLKNNYIGCLSVIIDKSYFNNFHFDNFNREDWLLWLKLLNNTSAFCLNEFLAYYRVHENSKSSNKFMQIKYNYIIYNKALGYSKFFSMLLLLRFLFFYSKYKIFKK